MLGRRNQHQNYTKWIIFIVVAGLFLLAILSEAIRHKTTREQIFCNCKYPNQDHHVVSKEQHQMPQYESDDAIIPFEYSIEEYDLETKTNNRDSLDIDSDDDDDDDFDLLHGDQPFAKYLLPGEWVPQESLDHVYATHRDQIPADILASAAKDGTGIMHETYDRICKQRAGSNHWVINVGAHYGDLDWNSQFHFAMCDWNVLYIEGSPQIFNVLKTLGPAHEAQFPEHQGKPRRILFANAAIGGEHGTLPFFFAPSPTDKLLQTSGFKKKQGTFNPAVIQRQTSSINVTVWTFEEILNRYHIYPEQVSMILIDVEGYDDVVVQSLPLGRLAPDLIVFEKAHLNTAGLRAANNYLAHYGYKIYTVDRTDIAGIRV